MYVVIAAVHSYLRRSKSDCFISAINVMVDKKKLKSLNYRVIHVVHRWQALTMCIYFSS